MYQYQRSRDVDQAGKAQELKKPIEYYISLYSANDPTSHFVEDASFVKLRELSLKYRLPRSFSRALARLGARTLPEGTPIHFLIPGRELQTLRLPLYTFGGPGGQGSAPARDPERCPIALARCAP